MRSNAAPAAPAFAAFLIWQLSLGVTFAACYTVASVGRIQAIDAKIERADKHISDLGQAIADFLASKPYKVGAKNHPILSDATTFFVEKARPIPPCIPIIAGDAIHNLRSALDHLAWQLVEASGNTPGSWTGFPIYDPSKFTTDKGESKFFEGKVKGMRPQIVNAIRGQQSYKGGNDQLWAIHDLDIVDKHHLSITMGFTSQYFRVQDTFDIPMRGWLLMKEGEDLVTITHKVKPEEQIEFAFDVILGEVGIFQGKSLVVSLSTMSDVAKNLVSDFSPFLI